MRTIRWAAGTLFAASLIVGFAGFQSWLVYAAAVTLFVVFCWTFGAFSRETWLTSDKALDAEYARIDQELTVIERDARRRNGAVS